MSKCLSWHPEAGPLQIGETTSETIGGLWAELAPRIKESRCVDEAAQALAGTVSGSFEESIVLARVFLTVPFFSLPPGTQGFTSKLAASSGAAEALKATTPVLALLGTYGREPSWRDRRMSKRHMAIPLISPTFVGSIPMIARLLKELGVPLSWVDSQDSEIIQSTLGSPSGMFYVERASQETDDQGRKIIAAQDFVSSHRVETVFGVGGAYLGGQILILVVFCRDVVPRDVAKRFLGLVVLFRDKTRKLIGQSRIFSEEFAR